MNRLEALKIFGERNCGTRVLGRLLEESLGVRCLPGTAAELNPNAFGKIRGDEAEIDAVFEGADAAHAWKHCATYFDDVASLDHCLTLFVVKHPLAWLASLYDRPYHQLGHRAGSIAELAATPWKTITRDRLGRRCFKPLELYRAKLASYFELAPRVACEFVRFEDLVLDPEAVLRRLGHAGPFVPHELSTKDDSKTATDYRAYYGEERWRERVADVTEQPDWAQVKQFGYF